MAKVFISFLGTSPYSEVTYVYEIEKHNVVKTQTRFVQVAMVSSLCKDWTADDRILIFRTDLSNKRNWIDTAGREGLHTELSRFMAENGIKARLNPEETEDPEKYMVPTGFNEKDLWSIFFKVYDCIENGDEIYFDVTHAFRTIPLFTTVLFNYCRFMKDSTVVSLNYGAYESLLTIHNLTLEQLKAMPAEKQSNLEVPIIDLTDIVKLQGVNEAVANFKQFGDMGSIIQILDDNRQRLNDSGQLKLHKAVMQVQTAMRQLNFYTQTSNLNALRDGKYFTDIIEVIDSILDSQEIPGPQRELLMEITNELEDVGFHSAPTYKNIEAAIKWSLNKNLIQQAVTLAAEYIKETYLRLYIAQGFRVGRSGYKNRSCISYILSVSKDYDLQSGRFVINERNWQRKLRDSDNDNGFQPAQVIDFINIEGVGEIEEPYNQLRDLRNGLNHASELKYKSLDKLKDGFMGIWTDCLKAFSQLSRATLWR